MLDSTRGAATLPVLMWFVSMYKRLRCLVGSVTKAEMGEKVASMSPGYASIDWNHGFSVSLVWRARSPPTKNREVLLA